MPANGIPSYAIKLLVSDRLVVCTSKHMTRLKSLLLSVACMLNRTQAFQETTDRTQVLLETTPDASYPH